MCIYGKSMIIIPKLLKTSLNSSIPISSTYLDNYVLITRTSIGISAGRSSDVLGISYNWVIWGTQSTAIIASSIVLHKTSIKWVIVPVISVARLFNLWKLVSMISVNTLVNCIKYSPSMLNIFPFMSSFLFIFHLDSTCSVSTSFPFFSTSWYIRVKPSLLLVRSSSCASLCRSFLIDISIVTMVVCPVLCHQLLFGPLR